MKPPIWRQDPAIHPHSCEIQTRYSDEDHLRHINNIAVAGYYDEARARFSRHIFSSLGQDDLSRIVTADSRVTYLREVFHRDVVEVCTGILRIGTASYDLGQALFQDGQCVGICTTTFVQATPTGSIPLSNALRAALQRFLIRTPETLSA